MDEVKIGDELEYRVRELTTDSILSEGTAVSRESIVSISHKLINMELELDQTLRDLDTNNRSKSPSTTKHSTRQTGRSTFNRRSGSIDPLASSRRSGSIDPGNHSDTLANKVKELTERLESLEKENHLLDTKYDQQRKRLNLAKRENDDLRSTLDSAISEIDKLGEEAQAAHDIGGDEAKSKATIRELQNALSEAHTEITELRIEKSKIKNQKSIQNNNNNDHTVSLISEDMIEFPLLQQAPSPSSIFNPMSQHGCSLVLSITNLTNLELIGIDDPTLDLELKVVYGTETRNINISLTNENHNNLSTVLNEIMMLSYQHKSESFLKLILSQSSVNLGEATLSLPDINLDHMNVCFELEENLPLNSILIPVTSPNTSSDPPKRASIKLSLTCINFNHVARQFAELEAFRLGFPDISFEAKEEKSSKLAIDLISGSIQALLAEVGHSREQLQQVNQQISQQREELDEERRNRVHLEATLSSMNQSNDVSLNPAVSTLSSIAVFNGDAPSTPQVLKDCQTPESLANENTSTSPEKSSLHPNTSSSSSMSSTSSVVDKMVEMAIEQPMQAFLLIAVVLMAVWCATSKMIHEAHIETLESRYCVFKHDYLLACDELGLDASKPIQGMLSDRVHNVSVSFQDCSIKNMKYENISLKYDQCNLDLLNERDVTEQLLSELTKYNEANTITDSNEDDENNSGWFFSGRSSSSKKEVIGQHSEKKNLENMTLEEQVMASAVGGNSGAQTIAALYKCRRESREESTKRVDAVIASETVTQSLHQCQQELSRIGTAHISSNAEHVTCEERLLKQEAWAASLAATNMVLHGHLRDANHELSSTQADYVSIKESSSKCEASIKALSNSRNMVQVKLQDLEEHNLRLANHSATLNATSTLLQKELLLANAENEKLIESSTNLTNELGETIKSRNRLYEEKADIQVKLTALEARARELDQSLRAGESKYRAMAILEASQQAGLSVLEKKIGDVSLQASEAAGDKETLAIRNGELASQLSVTEQNHAKLKKELVLKNSRLLELEQAMASIAAAEEVVSTTDTGGEGSDKTISTCTGSAANQSGGLCLTVRTGRGATAALDKAANAAADIARSAGLRTNWASPPQQEGKEVEGGDLGKGDAPGLVAIAGAVAAVWVFAVIMEKRGSLYKK